MRSADELLGVSKIRLLTEEEYKIVWLEKSVNRRCEHIIDSLLKHEYKDYLRSGRICIDDSRTDIKGGIFPNHEILVYTLLKNNEEFCQWFSTREKVLETSLDRRVDYRNMDYEVILFNKRGVGFRDDGGIFVRYSNSNKVGPFSFCSPLIYMSQFKCNIVAIILDDNGEPKKLAINGEWFKKETVVESLLEEYKKEKYLANFVMVCNKNGEVFHLGAFDIYEYYPGEVDIKWACKLPEKYMNLIR